MRFLTPALFIFLLSLFSCGPSKEELERQREQHIADSIDSLSRVAEMIRQKAVADSLHRIDSIKNFPCPELDELIRLNERAIYLTLNAGSIPDVNKKMDLVTDSIGKFEKHFMKNTFATLDPVCRHRYLGLTLKYSNDLKNAVIAISGYERLMPHEEEDRKNDSLVNAILYGE